MNIKMIVMDMDGTLLNSDQEISQKTYNTLIRAQKAGIMLVLASGRSYRTLTKYGEQLQMPKYNGYFICVNGAAITDTSTMETTFIRRLQLDEVKEIYESTRDFDIEVMGVLDDTLYDYIPQNLVKEKQAYRIANNIDEDVPYTAGTFSIVCDQSKNYPYIYYIDDYREIPQPINKICMAHNEEKLTVVKKHLLEKFGDKYTLASTSPIWLECTPKGIDKGSAILNLAKSKGIKNDEIVVFGDGENDLTMFQAVKYAVAMENAMPRVKESAYEITLDNNSDGIAVFLEKHGI